MSQQKRWQNMKFGPDGQDDYEDENLYEVRGGGDRLGVGALEERGDWGHFTEFLPRGQPGPRSQVSGPPLYFHSRV